MDASSFSMIRITRQRLLLLLLTVFLFVLSAAVFVLWRGITVSLRAESTLRAYLLGSGRCGGICAREWQMAEQLEGFGTDQNYSERNRRMALAG